ncbi:hypothetical protein, partial [Zhongshania sp.]|uniref:hypothetical protein n=1 Tax=Zhongshania sp. TaxID=1971902 RepID=UPI0035656343
LNLEDEQKRLAMYEKWRKAQRINYPELLQQRKLVTALEQLEQAREALRKTHNQYAALTDYIRKRQGAHLGNKQGDVYHEMQAAASRFGLKSKHTSEVLVALGEQALKQQKVG